MSKKQRIWNDLSGWLMWAGGIIALGQVIKTDPGSGFWDGIWWTLGLIFGFIFSASGADRLNLFLWRARGTSACSHSGTSILDAVRTIELEQQNRKLREERDQMDRAFRAVKDQTAQGDSERIELRRALAEKATDNKEAE